MVISRSSYSVTNLLLTRRRRLDRRRQLGAEFASGKEPVRMLLAAAK
jgi:hypothetical protein